MSKLTDSDSRVILQRLSWFSVSFYLLIFFFSLIFTLSFGLSLDAAVVLPFEFDNFGLSSDKELAAWLTLTSSFLFGSVLIFFIVRSTSKTWDYSATIVIWHFVISCIVKEEFPQNWIWWVTICVSGFLMSTCGEMMCYYLRDLREIKLEH